MCLALVPASSRRMGAEMLPTMRSGRSLRTVEPGVRAESTNPSFYQIVLGGKDTIGSMRFDRIRFEMPEPATASWLSGEFSRSSKDGGHALRYRTRAQTVTNVAFELP
jgi:hypothetical protein